MCVCVRVCAASEDILCVSLPNWLQFMVDSGVMDHSLCGAMTEDMQAFYFSTNFLEVGGGAGRGGGGGPGERRKGKWK